MAANTAAGFNCPPIPNGELTPGGQIAAAQPKLNPLPTECFPSQWLPGRAACVASKASVAMDELLREFLTETNESIDVVDAELVRFERDPNNAKILGNIFRLVHTIKGTCGFLNLPRLEALTHAAEALMGNFRDGLPVTADAVTLILATIDRIKVLLEDLERNQAEQSGNDQDLIARLDQLSAQPEDPRHVAPKDTVPKSAPPLQTLERPLRPGEVPLEE